MSQPSAPAQLLRGNKYGNPIQLLNWEPLPEIFAISQPIRKLIWWNGLTQPVLEQLCIQVLASTQYIWQDSKQISIRKQ